MVSEEKSGPGLLQRLILGIFVPILLAFMIIGIMLFVSVNLGLVRFTSIRDLGFNSLNELGAASLKESTASLNKLGEKMIQEKAQDVARQIEIYMKSHNQKSVAMLASDSRLREIAVQKVGETGYTAVHDNRGINYFHVNPQIVGTDLHALAAKLPDFVKIMDAGLKKSANGYYDWRDADGKVRPKYMFTTPVEGTNAIVAATTYIDEFSKPAKAIVEKMNLMEQAYSAQYHKRITLFLLIVAVDLVVLLGVIFVYSSSIVRPIRHLSEVADKISMGDLGATVNVKGKGEVLVLAQSIKRMQVSVRAAIERLQKVREGTVRK
ncbi:MAG TPA: HAMP domain-containing protein [Syntrophorhabdales bacterium]|nr:HAMP domain-containing protein [Syntrophorhabdales bacterium]